MSQINTRPLPFSLTPFSETHDALVGLEGVKPSPIPNENPTKSFWLDSSPDLNPLAKEGSTGPLPNDADICIIGSGITGVSAAYHISRLLTDKERSLQNPLKVVILEARDFCSGATGRNGGHCTAITFQEFSSYAKSYGTDEALRALALEKHVMHEVVDFLKSTRKEAEVDLVAGGNTTMWMSDEEAAQGKADYEAAKAAGVDLTGVHLLTKDEMLKTYGAPFPGAHTPGYNLWPMKLVTLLYRAAAASPAISLSLYTNTPVASISRLAGSIPDGTCPRLWSIATPRGTISCARVLHATNGYASHLLPHMAGPAGIVPTRSQVTALRASVSLDEITLSAWNANNGFEFWFPRPVQQGEVHPLVIFGGGRETAIPRFEVDVADDGAVNPVVGKMLRTFLPAVFPGKYEEGREPEMEWTGIMGFTKTSDPFVGPILDPAQPESDVFNGQYISAGYTGHGMTRAYGCAEAVSQMIVADIFGETWSAPEWLPRHHLTKNRLKD